MKKTGLKQLQIMAEEAAKSIKYLHGKLGTIIGAREFDRAKSHLLSREKAYKGILAKAEEYGKGDVLWKVTFAIVDSKRFWGAQKTIYYVNVEKEELDLLLCRDLNGLKYRVLDIKEIKTGTFDQ